MANFTNVCLFKETRVDLYRNNPETVIDIPVPSSSSSSISNATSSISTRGKPSKHNVSFAKDEDTFVQNHLATQGSIYFRRIAKLSRSYLWRVIEGNVLELRCADMTKGEKLRSNQDTNESQLEAGLILRFSFTADIRSNGVAITDSERYDSLSVFVLTKDNHFHILTLRPEFFYRPLASEAETATWYSSLMPNAFGMGHPFMIYATSPHDVWMALDNGGLLRMIKKDEAHAPWREATYNGSAWGFSFRGFMRWQGQNTVRYEDRNLDQNTALALAPSPDGEYMFAVGLNHTLRVWNIQSGKAVDTRDLLDIERKPQEIAQCFLNPANAHHIRVFNCERAAGDDGYFVLTFSPLDEGQFKFWEINKTSDTVEVNDLYPEMRFCPPDPDETNPSWILADFDIRSADEGRGVEMWVLWKYDTSFKLFTLKFDFALLPDQWDNGWIGCAPEVGHDCPRPVISDTDPEDITEKWMDYLFTPGRYTEPILQTALALYQSTFLNLGGVNPTEHQSLKEKMCSSIASTVTLKRRADGCMNYEQFREDTQVQWQHFWRLAEDLNKWRSEPISMAYDHYEDIPWVIVADGCCAIRDCSDTEFLVHNHPESLNNAKDTLKRRHHQAFGDGLMKDPGMLCGLVNMAAAFRESFPDELQESCKLALRSEILQDPSFSVSTRVQSFYDQCKFSEYVTDELFDYLSKRIGELGGFGTLMNNDLFYHITNTLPLRFIGRESHLRSTMLGIRVLVKGVEEMAQLSWRMLFDLLILVVFVEIEIHQDGEVMEKFDVADLYTTLLDLLKQHEVMIWLSKATRKRTSYKHRPLTDDSQARSVSQTVETVSLLEDLFAGDPRPLPATIAPQTTVLTYNIREVISWIVGAHDVTFDNALVYIQCNLLANRNIHLASSFLKYQPSTAWSTYVKGRLYLMRNEPSLAALCFQKAAYVLAHGKPLGQLQEMSSDLLSLLDVDFFQNGLAKYHQHILTLFESSKHYSYVSRFAHLALQFTPPNNPDLAPARTDLLSRLFHSALHTSSYCVAYAALSILPDPALQRSSLSSLITHTITHNRAATLISLPFATPILHHHVDTTLSSLAARVTDPSSGPEYHRVLAAYRIQRDEFKGAAQVVWDRLAGIRRAAASKPPKTSRGRTFGFFGEPDDSDYGNLLSGETELLNELRIIINLLELVDHSQAWLFAENGDVNIVARSGDKTTSGATSSTSNTRRVLTLEQVKKLYQDELDRVSVIERGAWEIGTGDGDEMDLGE